MKMLTKLMRGLALVSVMILLVPTTGVAQPSTQQACWGQASKVFAQTGAMGAHASEQPTPRLGLRNLARSLFEDGVLADDSMQSLGAFVATELGLSIDACLEMP